MLQTNGTMSYPKERRFEETCFRRFWDPYPVVTDVASWRAVTSAGFPGRAQAAINSWGMRAGGACASPGGAHTST